MPTQISNVGVYVEEVPSGVRTIMGTSTSVAAFIGQLCPRPLCPHPMHTTSTRFLLDLGVLDRSTLAVHAVHVTPDDVRVLKEKGCSVVLCPRSNDRLFVGSAPHKLLKSAGLSLALGTDSLASNDSLFLWDELRYL